MRFFWIAAKLAYLTGEHLRAGPHSLPGGLDRTSSKGHAEPHGYPCFRNGAELTPHSADFNISASSELGDHKSMYA